MIRQVLGASGQNRVLRGGSWNNEGRNCRSANRNGNTPDNRNDNSGFRLAREQKVAGWHLLTQPMTCPGLLRSAWQRVSWSRYASSRQAWHAKACRLLLLLPWEDLA